MPRLSSRLIATERACEIARPRGPRTEYRVAGFRGLVLRVSANGAKSWVYNFRSPVTHAWRKKSLGNYPMVGLARAKELALDCLTKVRAGKDPLAPPPRPVMTFETLVDEYQEAHCNRHSSAWSQEVERVLSIDVLPHLKACRCGAITRHDISQVVERVAKRGRYAAANHVLKVVRGAFRWGLATGRCDADPTIGTRRYPSRPRERVLSDDEIRMVWNVKSEFRDAYRLALLLGLRVGELLNGCTDEVALNLEPLWTIPASRTKSRREHPVPLPPLAVRILKERSRWSPWLFPSPEDGQPLRTRSAAQYLLKLGKRMGITETFGPHDLRRTCATRLGDLGVSDDIVERVLGHAPSSVTRKHYNRAKKLTEVRAALEMWASEVERLVRNAPYRSCYRAKLR